MFQTITIPKLHLEHRLWINELNFYKEELGIFERHLEDIISKNDDIEVTSNVEHFQNSFILQKEVIDHLKHDLNIAEKQLVAFIKDLSGLGLSSIKMDNHPVLRDRMQTFRKLYKELKNEFRSFEATLI